MKTRTGFVSNSSSTSFCVLGKDYDIFWDEKYAELDGYDDVHRKEVEDDVEESASHCGLAYILNPECDTVTIGFVPEAIEDSMTFKEFRVLTEEALVEFEKMCGVLDKREFTPDKNDKNIRRDTRPVRWIYGEFDTG